MLPYCLWSGNYDGSYHGFMPAYGGKCRCHNLFPHQRPVIQRNALQIPFELRFYVNFNSGFLQQPSFRSVLFLSCRVRAYVRPGRRYSSRPQGDCSEIPLAAYGNGNRLVPHGAYLFYCRVHKGCGILRFSVFDRRCYFRGRDSAYQNSEIKC